jgi:hypothetical protein
MEKDTTQQAVEDYAIRAMLRIKDYTPLLGVVRNGDYPWKLKMWTAYIGVFTNNFCGDYYLNGKFNMEREVLIFQLESEDAAKFVYDYIAVRFNNEWDAAFRLKTRKSTNSFPSPVLVKFGVK